MTREEAYNRIDGIIEKHEVDDMYVTIINDKDYDALRMARKSLEQRTGHWIPLTVREMDEDEKQHYIDIDKPEIADYGEMLNCELPEDGEEVLITVNGYVTVDTFVRDADDGCYFEYADLENVTAWMPLPEPYKKGKEDKE